MAGIRALARWRTLNFNTQRAIWFSQLRLLRPHGLLELHRKVLGESLARGSPLSSSRFAALAPFYTRRAQIGRASCRERVCQYVSISVVAVSLKQKFFITLFYT